MTVPLIRQCSNYRDFRETFNEVVIYTERYTLYVKWEGVPIQRNNVQCSAKQSYFVIIGYYPFLYRSRAGKYRASPDSWYF